MADEVARICAVCGRVLERWGYRDPTVPDSYRHALVDEPADHLPVAVRASDAPHQARYRCDFCLREPITHTLVTDTDIEVPEINCTWDAEWAMCPQCTRLVMDGDWLGLRRRAFAEFEAQFGAMHEETKVAMRIAYRTIREHTVMIYQEG